jgi:hypothetical protein
MNIKIKPSKFQQKCLDSLASLHLNPNPEGLKELV